MEKQLQPYFSYRAYMQKLFSQRVYKISIDGGFSCPNRDGTKSYQGCIFCDAQGSSSKTNPQNTPIKAQVLKNLKIRQSRYKAKKFIAYFQSFTNTYAPLEVLKKRYDEAVFAHPDIIGLSIATRPDSIDEEKIKLIASYKEKLPFVSLEYGLQTIHEKTLQLINRQEHFSDFLKALELARKYQIHPVAHVILNLPGEGRKEMLETAEALRALKIEGLKIHLLAALKNTALEQLFIEGKWQGLSFQDSVSLCCDFLERIPKATVIHRVSSQNGHHQDLVHPLWMKEKKEPFMEALKAEFFRRQSYQGS
ncbi:MAG: TIGR01212 family radical SAM protein [Parachlamydiales bacterium]|jgi:hypothetical protein